MFLSEVVASLSICSNIHFYSYSTVTSSLQLNTILFLYVPGFHHPFIHIHPSTHPWGYTRMEQPGSSPGFSLPAPYKLVVVVRPSGPSTQRLQFPLHLPDQLPSEKSRPPRDINQTRHNKLQSDHAHTIASRLDKATQ